MALPKIKIGTRKATLKEKERILKQIEALKRKGEIKKGDKVKIIEKKDGRMFLLKLNHLKPKKKIRKSGIFV